MDSIIVTYLSVTYFTVTYLSKRCLKFANSHTFEEAGVVYSPFAYIFTYFPNALLKVRLKIDIDTEKLRYVRDLN